MSLQGPSVQALAMENFEQLPLQTQMSSYDDEMIPLRNQANQAYIEKNYPEAIRLFQELARREPNNLNHRLLAGISQVGDQQAEAAITILRPLADGSNEQVTIEAAWYLALAYLLQEKTASAKTYLDKVAANQGFNAAKAAELLQELE
jgi:cytochrome c-type biogenesis protein CcmH/NrfG